MMKIQSMNKFNFIPVYNLEVEEEKGNTVSISVKFGIISFSKNYIRNKKLDGKYVRFYVDKDKKTLGWRVVNEQGNLDVLKGLKRIVPTGKDVIYRLSIKSILNKMGITDTSKSYTKLEVQEYIHNGGHLDGVIKYDYVTIK